VFDKNKVTKLEVYTLKGQMLLLLDKNFSFPTNVVKEEKQFGRFEPNQSVFIRGKNLPVFARNAEVSVVAHTRSGDRFGYRGRIDMSTEFQLNISLRQDTEAQLEDRRRFYKINAELSCMLTSVTRDDRHILLEPAVKSIITDINIGGIFMKSNTQVEFKRDDKVAVVLSEVSGDTELTADILRVATDSEGKITGYGCAFLFLNARQEEVIARFVHKTQINRRIEEKDEFFEEDSQ
jgi:hypothetical protein